MGLDIGPDEELDVFALGDEALILKLADDDALRDELVRSGDLRMDEAHIIRDYGVANTMKQFRGGLAYRYLSLYAKAELHLIGEALADVDLQSRDARMLQATAKASQLFDRWIDRAISVVEAAEQKIIQRDIPSEF